MKRNEEEAVWFVLGLLLVFGIPVISLIALIISNWG